MRESWRITTPGLGNSKMEGIIPLPSCRDGSNHVFGLRRQRLATSNRCISSCRGGRQQVNALIILAKFSWSFVWFKTNAPESGFCLCSLMMSRFLLKYPYLAFLDWGARHERIWPFFSMKTILPLHSVRVFSWRREIYKRHSQQNQFILLKAKIRNITCGPAIKATQDDFFPFLIYDQLFHIGRSGAKQSNYGNIDVSCQGVKVEPCGLPCGNYHIWPMTGIKCHHQISNRNSHRHS